jgi:hypothetical protein
MNPLGIVQLALVAAEGVACALHPKLRKENRKKAVGFGLFYLAFLLLGLGLIIMLVRSLYFQK